MFRVATRSFAPANISCRRQARLLGCQIASHPYQRGLLEIVRKIVHPDGGHCERCDHGGTAHRSDAVSFRFAGGRSKLDFEFSQNDFIPSLIDPP